MVDTVTQQTFEKDTFGANDSSPSAELKAAARAQSAFLAEFMMHIPKQEISEKKTEKIPEKANNEKFEKSTKELWGEFSGGDVKKAICADACIQPSDLGNCYFMAAMAAVARIDPDRIKDMIKVEADGTYTVKFPGLDKAYNVDPATTEEISKIEGGITKYGSWPLILMKAMGTHYGGAKDRSPMYGSDHGSRFSAGMKAFYKEGVKYGGMGDLLGPAMTEKTLHSTLMQKCNPENKKDEIPVSASANITDNDKKIEKGHVYTVMKYEAEPSDISSGKVTLRNPWGGPDAIRVLTLKEFKGVFSQLTYPELRPPKR